jgi:hypothetical protein
MILSLVGNDRQPSDDGRPCVSARGSPRRSRHGEGGNLEDVLRHGRQLPGKNGIIRAIGRIIITATEEIHELIRLWEENYFAFGEFQNLMIGQLRKLPAAERQDALETLSAHANEDIRQVAAEFRLLQHNEGLSKDIDYVRQHTPLRPGSRLELSGGYDDQSSGGKPAWLNGRDCYKATFQRFVSYGENTVPVALVEFDEVVEGPGYKGRYGVLFAGYGPNSIAWSETEDVVSIYVSEALPEATLIRFFRASGSAAETHASYRVEKAV